MLLTMIKWALKRKWVIIGGAISAFLIGAYVHIKIDTKRDADLRLCTEKRSELVQDVADRDASIGSLNGKVARLNQQLIDLTDESNRRVADAKAEAIEARIQRDIISGELADARQDLQEALQNDQDYANWAAVRVPTIGWVSLRKAASGGTNRVHSGSDREGNDGTNTSRPNDDP